MTTRRVRLSTWRDFFLTGGYFHPELLVRYVNLAHNIAQWLRSWRQASPVHGVGEDTSYSVQRLGEQILHGTHGFRNVKCSLISPSFATQNGLVSYWAVSTITEISSCISDNAKDRRLGTFQRHPSSRQQTPNPPPPLSNQPTSDSTTTIIPPPEEPPPCPPPSPISGSRMTSPHEHPFAVTDAYLTAATIAAAFHVSISLHPSPSWFVLTGACRTHTRRAARSCDHSLPDRVRACCSHGMCPVGVCLAPC